MSGHRHVVHETENQSVTLLRQQQLLTLSDVSRLCPAWAPTSEDQPISLVEGDSGVRVVAAHVQPLTYLCQARVLLLQSLQFSRAHIQYILLLDVVGIVASQCQERSAVSILRCSLTVGLLGNTLLEASSIPLLRLAQSTPPPQVPGLVLLAAAPRRPSPSSLSRHLPPVRSRLLGLSRLQSQVQ